ncbi:hypothetical protein CEPID_10460 [Corynebacterium epidermidicanis]|uniref:Uncharacterized protein n=1 Tax=Corynebacterium epidermidicanis TaxID=1050174 RepID=A0A0G3GYI6_9CORY|nr:hypothetical protein CEPID_10460 [Corynebacterium epidermidicanis]
MQGKWRNYANNKSKIKKLATILSFLLPFCYPELAGRKFPKLHPEHIKSPTSWQICYLVSNSTTRALEFHHKRHPTIPFRNSASLKSRSTPDYSQHFP